MGAVRPRRYETPDHRGRNNGYGRSDRLIDVTTPVNFDDEVEYECYLGGGGECKAVAFCCLCFWDIPVCDVCMLKGKKEIELKTFRILDLES